MSEVKIEHKPSLDQLKKMGVFEWPIWEKEISEFPWTYDEREKCYFLEGAVQVLNEEGQLFVFGKGDFVTFPEGMSCTWKIIKPVKKHYLFG